MDKAAMYKLTYGLFVLTAKEGEKENGCIINTAMQVTTSPNRIIIVVNKANYTHDMVMRTREFNVSCLGTGASSDVFKHFGFQSGKNVNKMEACYPHAKNGIPYVGSVAVTCTRAGSCRRILFVRCASTRRRILKKSHSGGICHVGGGPIGQGKGDGMRGWRGITDDGRHVRAELP